METRSVRSESRRGAGRVRLPRRGLRVLVIDIGGSSVKVLASGLRKPVVIPSGPGMTPRKLVTAIQNATSGWKYDVVSIGYPGRVVRGRRVEDPPNLGKGWLRFDFAKAFSRPVKVFNDAAMQALGSYCGGRMLFLSLGTGLGSALILEGILHPMELGDLPYREGRTYAEILSKRVIKRLGKARWSRLATTAICQLKAAIQADYTVLGGGEAALVRKLPPGVIRGDNSKAFVGGFRLWQPSRSWHCELRRKP